MSTHRRNLEEIFHEASEITNAEARAEYVVRACSGDQELRCEVEFLLKSDDKAGQFMETPAIDPGILGRETPPVEAPGSVIGHFKLLEKIGEGGMAVVYMAEQQYPLHRKVALKLIKLGMDSKQITARFEAERQALAMMDHPYIARIFDAGTTGSGRPYFVMELVKGLSITEFCNKKRLSMQDRLALFVRVCQAVHHAHQKGVIHRDIKPSNIMVTLHDGQPMPKVIDFGIAKATNRRLTEKTLFTHYAQIVGTPEYMSPEQAEFGDQDVDTRTDVYSLGALLYELLTGKPPFEVDHLRSKGYAEIQRIIREEEPAKPSTRISTLGEALLDIADLRNATPDTLRRLMRADLDWIVMKTLEKDRTRRYESVRELTRDIERHLKHEPVLASPPDLWYVTRKYLRRHRTLVTTLAAVIMALGLGFAVSSSFSEIQVSRDQQLSTVQRLTAEGQYQAALKEIENSALNRTRDASVQIIHAQLLYNVDRKPEAQERLERLVDHPTEIAGAAHYLLSRIKQHTDARQARSHQEQANSLLPRSANGHAMRALTAANPDEALQWLEKALALNPSHYASREARALIRYGMHDYVGMRLDAEAIVVLRPQYYMGYALRALARCNLNEPEKALSDHEQAIAFCESPRELAALHRQRQETYWRQGNYEAAWKDAHLSVKLKPQSLGYRLSLAKILFKLHRYEQAKQELDYLIQHHNYARSEWLAEMSRYMSDATCNQESWELPEDVLQDWSLRSRHFLPIISNLYRKLNPLATRLITNSHDISSWSPDGRQLAYSRYRPYEWNDEALNNKWSISYG